MTALEPGPPGSIAWLEGDPRAALSDPSGLTERPAAFALVNGAEGERLRLRWGSVTEPLEPLADGACRLCDAPGVTVVSRHPAMTVGRCPACGCGQVLALAPAPADADYAERYGAELQADKAEALWHLFRQRTAELAGVASVLDVGCGEGAFLDLARRAGLETAGLEIAPASAAAALAGGHEVYRRSAEVEVFPPGRHFDAVVLWDVLEHLERPGLALANAWRALAEGGRLLVVTPMMGSAFDRLGLAADRLSRGRLRQLLEMCWTRDHLCRFDRAGLVRVLQGLGFEDCRADAISLLSLAPDRYAGGAVMASWSGRPALDRAISRLGVTTVRLLGLHNKVLVDARKPAA